jgi:hypothetical protein
MSAEAWVFQYVVQTPSCRALCTVRWVGQDSSDYMNSPSTDLRGSSEDLEIWSIVVWDCPPDEDWTFLQESAESWVCANESVILQEIVENKFQPDWEWDT